MGIDANELEQGALRTSQKVEQSIDCESTFETIQLQMTQNAQSGDGRESNV